MYSYKIPSSRLLSRYLTLPTRRGTTLTTPPTPVGRFLVNSRQTQEVRPAVFCKQSAIKVWLFLLKSILVSFLINSFKWALKQRCSMFHLSLTLLKHIET